MIVRNLDGMRCQVVLRSALGVTIIQVLNMSKKFQNLECAGNTCNVIGWMDEGLLIATWNDSPASLFNH